MFFKSFKFLAPFLALSLTIAIFTGITAPSLSQAGEGGISGGGGGDLYAFEFVSFGRSLVKLMQNTSRCQSTEVTATTLEGKIDSTRVVSKPITVWLDHEVGAINYPDEKLIELSQSYWDTTTPKQIQKMGFALHEYLRILGKDDSHYQISAPLLDCLQRTVHLSIDGYSKSLGNVTLQSFSIEDLSLGEAILKGDSTAIESALKSGAYVNASFKVTISDSVYGSTTPSGVIRNRLIQKRQELDALSLAALEDSPDIIRLLVEHDAVINHFADGDLFHRTALVWAARFGNKKAAETLIDLGALLQFEWKTSEGVKRSWSALASASNAGGLQMVRFLLKKGTDPCFTVGRYYQYTPWEITYGQADSRIFNEIIEAQKNAGCYLGQAVSKPVHAALSMNGDYELLSQNWIQTPETTAKSFSCQRFIGIRTRFENELKGELLYKVGALDEIDRVPLQQSCAQWTSGWNSDSQEDAYFGSRKKIPFLEGRCRLSDYSATRTREEFRLSPDDEVLVRTFKVSHSFGASFSEKRCVYRRISD